MSNKCVVYGCKKDIEIKVHRLCRSHYMRYRNKGDPGSAFVEKKTRLKIYRSDDRNDGIQGDSNTQ